MKPKSKFMASTITSQSDGLCCRWRIGYIRQISLNTTPGTSQQFSAPIGRRTSQRSQHISTVESGIDGKPKPAWQRYTVRRHADPWVDANWAVESFLNRVHPQPSEGRFFQRLSDSNGLSRLELVEWFKYLMLRHRNHQVIIFDPDFEVQGWESVVPNASRQGDYIIFTSLPKPTPLIVCPWYARFWDWFAARKQRYFPEESDKQSSSSL